MPQLPDEGLNSLNHVFHMVIDCLTSKVPVQGKLKIGLEYLQEPDIGALRKNGKSIVEHAWYLCKCHWIGAGCHCQKYDFGVQVISANL